VRALATCVLLLALAPAAQAAGLKVQASTENLSPRAEIGIAPVELVS